MPSPTFFLICAAGACLYWGTSTVYHSAKKAEQKIVRAFKHGLRKHAEPNTK